MESLYLVIGIAVLLVIAIIGIVVASNIQYKKGVRDGIEQRKQQAESVMGSAEKEAERILDDARKDAENAKKTALVEAKDDIHKLRSDAEKEIKDRRAELTRQERRMQQKEESLDKKNDNFEKKEELLNQKIKKADDALNDAEAIKKSQMDVLERISEFTKEQAKEYILSNLENDLIREKAVKIASLR